MDGKRDAMRAKVGSKPHRMGKKLGSAIDRLPKLFHPGPGRANPVDPSFLVAMVKLKKITHVVRSYPLPC